MKFLIPTAWVLIIFYSKSRKFQKIFKLRYELYRINITKLNFQIPDFHRCLQKICIFLAYQNFCKIFCQVVLRSSSDSWDLELIFSDICKDYFHKLRLHPNHKIRFRFRNRYKRSHWRSCQFLNIANTENNQNKRDRNRLFGIIFVRIFSYFNSRAGGVNIAYAVGLSLWDQFRFNLPYYAIFLNFWPRMTLNKLDKNFW